MPMKNVILKMILSKTKGKLVTTGDAKNCGGGFLETRIEIQIQVNHLCINSP